MRRLLPLLLLAACSGPPRSDYVPGGAGLPQQARRRYRAALAQERKGKQEAALQSITELCLRYPTRLGFHLYRLRLARRVLGAEQAGRLYGPPPPGVDATRAEILSRLGRLGAEQLTDLSDVLQFALKREPDEAFWHLALADVEQAGHDPVADRAEGDRRRGRVRSSEGAEREADTRLDRAMEHAEKALTLDPLFAEAHLLVGFICTRKADAADRMDDKDEWRRRGHERYTEALRLDPESLPALLNRAENWLYFDRYTEAKKDLDRAARLAPNEPLVWTNLGSIYYDTGQLARAVSSYERALELAPRDARSRAALADCLRRQGEVESAVGELLQARQDAGNDDELLAEIAFKLGAIHEHEQRYREAVQEYERHIHHVEQGGLEGGSKAKAQSRIRHIVDHAFE